MKTIEEVLDKIKETLEQKGNTYGPTYRRVAAMLNVRPQYSILVRILEKVARVHNMLNVGQVDFDLLQEELIDIACYAVLAAFECTPCCPTGYDSY